MEWYMADFAKQKEYPCFRVRYASQNKGAPSVVLIWSYKHSL
jgi:hypothetical protein